MKRLILVLATMGFAGYAAASQNPEDKRVFHCAPKVVSETDTILLSKDSAALRELAVRRPGSIAPHFLVVSRPPAKLRPLMSPEDLSAAKRVRIKVNELTGLEWRLGALQEPVFTAPGIYTFIISPVLESEDLAYTCSVEYQPHDKRANNSSKPIPRRNSA